MALGRCGNVNNIRSRDAQHFLRIGKAFRDIETLGQLFGHEQFLIASGYNLAIRNAMDRRHMLVGNLAAPDDTDSWHG
jgi:hypothetical protein